MPTTSTPKPESGKRILTVRWRDNVWYPRIVIRSASRRVATGSFRQYAQEAHELDRIPCGRPRRSDALRRQLPAPGRCEFPSIPFNLRSRSLNLPGSDTSFEI
jgi:hypothetical protein